MDNKHWKLSRYSNYSKWQQSPGYLLPHLHFFPPHPLMAFPMGCIKPYATLISIAKTGRNLFFSTELPDRLIHLFPYSLCSNCRSALAGWLPCSVLPRAGNLKYCLELDTLNIHILLSQHYSLATFLLCLIRGLSVPQIFPQRSCKGPHFKGWLEA